MEADKIIQTLFLTVPYEYEYTLILSTLVYIIMKVAADLPHPKPEVLNLGGVAFQGFAETLSQSPKP